MLCPFVCTCRVFVCWRCQSILLTAWRSRWNRLGGGRGARCVGSAVRGCGTGERSGSVTWGCRAGAPLWCGAAAGSGVGIVRNVTSRTTTSSEPASLGGSPIASSRMPG